ncbi:hypothetical protein [Thermaurantiacus sp.]
MTPGAEAWLRVIARDGWRSATLDTAAREAGAPPAALASEAGDAFDAVGALLEEAGRAAMLGAAGDGSTRDRLFDGFMQGLDVLQAHRSAVLALVASRDPGVMALAAARAAPALRRLAAAAGVTTAGPEGALRLAALATVAARLFAAWRRDESPDLSKTMAALDRDLARAERLAGEGPLGLLKSLVPAVPGLGRRDRAPEPAPDPPGE